MINLICVFCYCQSVNEKMSLLLLAFLFLYHIFKYASVDISEKFVECLSELSLGSKPVIWDVEGVIHTLVKVIVSECDMITSIICKEYRCGVELMDGARSLRNGKGPSTEP